VAQLSLVPKAADQMKKDAQRLVDRFPTLQDVNARAVKQWIDELRTKGTSISSIKRLVWAWRSYWKYLGSIDAVPSDKKPPFPSVEAKREERSRKYLPYSTGDVVRLWEASQGVRGKQGKPDPLMADLIMLGAYTGCRIEELCSLKWANITASAFKITDAKTAAGLREVPIHSELRALVARRRKENEAGRSADEYLLPGLPFNKYGDRSNAVGKRFGRLKKALGFGEDYGFHSLRATVVTLLENAGISENLAADIVGHDKPRITYGLYSGGATLAVKAEALEKVRYPFPKAKRRS
jgi:integrase